MTRRKKPEHTISHYGGAPMTIARFAKCEHKPGCPQYSGHAADATGKGTKRRSGVAKLMTHIRYITTADDVDTRPKAVRWTPSFGPKSGLAKVEPAGSVLVVVVSCELGCRPGPGTRNRPTPVRGDGVQVAASAPRSGVGAERRTWRRSSTPAPGAEAARALMRRGTSTSSHRTRPASDSPTTYAVGRHCRSGSSARFPRAPVPRPKAVLPPVAPPTPRKPVAVARTTDTVPPPPSLRAAILARRKRETR